MKKYITIYIAGLFTGFIFVVFVNQDNKIDESQIKIEQIEGEKIIHKDYNFKGKKITFKTKSDGPGMIKTEIPKNFIPEVRHWNTKTNSIQASIFYQYHNKELYPSINISYWKRWSIFSIGGGVIFSNKSFGLNVGLQYWF